MELIDKYPGDADITAIAGIFSCINLLNYKILKYSDHIYQDPTAAAQTRAARLQTSRIKSF